MKRFMCVTSSASAAALSPHTALLPTTHGSKMPPLLLLPNRGVVTSSSSPSSMSHITSSISSGKTSETTRTNASAKDDAAAADEAFMSLGQSLTKLCSREKSTAILKSSKGRGHHQHQHHAPTPPPSPTASLTPLPEDLNTEADAQQAIHEILSRIGAGVDGMQKWRQRHFVRSTVVGVEDEEGAVEKGCSSSSWVEKVVPLRRGGDVHDREFIRWAVEEAYCVVSPFVELRRSLKNDDESEKKEKIGEEEGTTFYAKKGIPAGVILFSIPSELAIEGTSSSSSLVTSPSYPEGSTVRSEDDDHVTAFFRDVEDLCLQLAVELPSMDTAAEEDNNNNSGGGSGPHTSATTTLSGYTQYLTSAATPPRNLPYMSLNEVFGKTEGGQMNTDAATVIQLCIEQLKDIPISEHSKRRCIIDKTLSVLDLSLPQLLWFDFHVVRSQQPMRLSAFRMALLSESVEEQRRLLTKVLNEGALRRLASKSANAADVSLLRNLLARKKETSRSTTQSPSSALKASTVVFADGEEDVGNGVLSPPTQRKNNITPTTASSLPAGETLVQFLTPDECDALLPPLPDSAVEEFAWLVSIVLSRRLGSSLCIPLLDKLQHYIDPSSSLTTITPSSSSPAAYYSMANRPSMTGLDVFENIIAGVEGVYLYEPYVHVYALRDIIKGERITLSYSDLNPNKTATVRHSKDDSNTLELLSGGASKAGGGGDSLMWVLLWGFLPAQKATLNEEEIKQIAGFISGNRIHAAQRMFPPPAQTPPVRQ